MLHEIPNDRLSADQRQLIEAAIHAARHLSYSPYSKYPVGAAVRLQDGTIIKGANQENASFPVGLCAERSTLATAHNLRPGVTIAALAIACTAGSGAPITPCGMCRQAIAEYQSRQQEPMHIIMYGTERTTIADTIQDLLPLAFAK